MKNHEGCVRAYVRNSNAWYSKSLNGKISIMIGMYHPEGGTSGEFEVEFIEIHKNKPLAARLKAFEDSWSALWLIKDLLEKMAEFDSEIIQEPEFCNLLDSLGIVDITEYEKDKLYSKYIENLENEIKEKQEQLQKLKSK
jgi:hypothetical protein